MAKKTIVWSKKANLELKGVLKFYTNRNGNTNYSLKILEKVEGLLKALIDNEYIGRLTNNKKTRVIAMDVYLIFYEIQNNQIEVLSFWDNRQNPKRRIDDK